MAMHLFDWCYLIVWFHAGLSNMFIRNIKSLSAVSVLHHEATSVVADVLWGLCLRKFLCRLWSNWPLDAKKKKKSCILLTAQHRSDCFIIISDGFIFQLDVRFPAFHIGFDVFPCFDVKSVLPAVFAFSFAWNRFEILRWGHSECRTTLRSDGKIIMIYLFIFCMIQRKNRPKWGRGRLSSWALLYFLKTCPRSDSFFTSHCT